MTTVLITGASGMIGRHLREALLKKEYTVIGVDRKEDSFKRPNYIPTLIDLSDTNGLKSLYEEHLITHTIHLAALAHTEGVEDLSYETYYTANVTNARNVFEAAKEGNVLFISTVDVYGLTTDVVDGKSVIEPISVYGKTKALAEAECKKKCRKYNIYRFSPVYTNEIKRDIQKRYYLKYPNWAYVIGKGSNYEVLNIKNAVMAMMDWIDTDPDGMIKVIKDKRLLNTKEILCEERMAGRAKYVIRLPKWLVNAGYAVIRLTGKNKYTYLLNKAVHPLRTK